MTASEETPKPSAAPTVRLATVTDIPALLSLQARYFVGNLAPEARAEGFLSVLLDVAEVVEFLGAPIARQRWALRGPVLIETAARGRGVYTAFNRVTLAASRGRYDVGVVFVAADNPRSLHTTTTKLGATPLAEFDVGGRRYHFLAFSFDAPDRRRV